MPRGSRSTGMFQQQELRQKLKRLEEEIARTRAAADAASRRASREGESPAATCEKPTPERDDRS